MRQREQAVFERGPISPRSVGANSSRNPNRKVRRSLSGVETLLDLQRTHGNAFVQRLVQRRLAVSQTGEQEADRVADAVVRKNDASISMPAIFRYPKTRVQRMCAECEGEMQRQEETGNEEGEEKLQRQAVPGGATSASSETEDAIGALQGGGQSLPESVRADIEPRMGYDFGNVRIHADGHAARLVRSVSALAFAVGRDVIFGAGEYRPESSAVKRLLAHELTHVVQQTSTEHISTRLLRRPPTEGTFGQDVWPYTRRHHSEPQCQLSGGPLVQRQPLGTGGEVMGNYIAGPGDSLSLIAGYPSDGWRARLDQLIAANPDHPNIKNRTPDGPQYGWLEVGDVINVPWLPPAERLPGTGFTPPETSELPASPAPWQDVWVGGNAQGVVFEVMRNGIPVRVLRKYKQLGIKDWRTLVCEHNAWPDPPDLRRRMEAAAAAVATQNPRVLPESAAAHRVSLVVFADADTAYYTYNGHGAIVFRVDFNPGDYSDAVVHELSHALLEFHRVGATPGSENAAPDEVLLAVESLYEELAKTTNVPIPTEKFDPKKPPPFEGGAEQKPAGLVMFSDMLWSGSGGHPWDDAHELYASAYAGNLQAPKVLKEIIAHYQKADPAIAPLAEKMFEILAKGATREAGDAAGTHVSPIKDLIAGTTAEIGWAAKPETMYKPVTERTYCKGTDEPELDF